MFPTINKKETGVNLRRIMDMRGVKPKDIQEYLGFGCVQSVYRWLDGVSVPTVDNLYAISKHLLLSVRMEQSPFTQTKRVMQFPLQFLMERMWYLKQKHLTTWKQSNLLR